MVVVVVVAVAVAIAVAVAVAVAGVEDGSHGGQPRNLQEYHQGHSWRTLVVGVRSCSSSSGSAWLTITDNGSISHNKKKMP